MTVLLLSCLTFSQLYYYTILLLLCAVRAVFSGWLEHQFVAWISFLNAGHNILGRLNGLKISIIAFPKFRRDIHFCLWVHFIPECRVDFIKHILFCKWNVKRGVKNQSNAEPFLSAYMEKDQCQDGDSDCSRDGASAED